MDLSYFDDQWLGMEAYREWLLHGDDCISAKRKVCPIPRNKIELSNMGERTIKSHAKGKKHCDKLALYIQSCCIKFTPVSKGSAESPDASSTSTFSSTLDKFVVPEAVTDAEIRWCPLIDFVHVMGWLICLGVCFLTALLLKSFVYRKAHMHILSIMTLLLIFVLY